MVKTILQICTPSTPTWAMYTDDDGEFRVAVDLWALVLDEDGDHRIVGVEMKDMHYIIDDDTGFTGYTHEAPSEDTKGRML